MEIDFNKINECLHNEFPFSRTNLIVRDEFVGLGPGQPSYTVELIVDDKHVARAIPKEEFYSLNREMAKFYLEGIFNNLITTMRDYRNETI